MGELTKVATLSEIPPGTCRQVDAGGQAVAVFNVAGTLYAIGGTCAHRSGARPPGRHRSASTRETTFKRERYCVAVNVLVLSRGL